MTAGWAKTVSPSHYLFSYIWFDKYVVAILRQAGLSGGAYLCLVGNIFWTMCNEHEAYRQEGNGEAAFLPFRKPIWGSCSWFWVTFLLDAGLADQLENDKASPPEAPMVWEEPGGATLALPLPVDPPMAAWLVLFRPIREQVRLGRNGLP